MLVVDFTPVYSPGKYSHYVMRMEQEAGWAPEPVWDFGREKNLLSLTGIEPCTIQPKVVTIPSMLPDSLLVGLKQNMFPIMNTTLS